MRFFFQLFELLRVVEDIRLAPEVLEPDPVDIAGTVGFLKLQYSTGIVGTAASYTTAAGKQSC
jgi:hypothetical protein